MYAVASVTPLPEDEKCQLLRVLSGVSKEPCFVSTVKTASHALG